MRLCLVNVLILLHIRFLYQVLLSSLSWILDNFWRLSGAKWAFVVVVIVGVLLRLFDQHLDCILAFVFVEANYFVHAESKNDYYQDSTTDNKV